MSCKKALIYVNISYDGWIIKSLPSGRHFIECSVVHIFDNHMVIIDSHDDTDVPIRRRKSRTMIDDDSSRFRIISSWYTLFFSIFDPVFCISSPSDIFIFCDKTGTVSPNKITTSFAYLERECIVTIRDSLRIFCRYFLHNRRFYCCLYSSICWFYRRCWSRFWKSSNCWFFCWIFCWIREEKFTPDTQSSSFIHIIC